MPLAMAKRKRATTTVGELRQSLIAIDARRKQIVERFVRAEFLKFVVFYQETKRL